jgi:hypothetical protein
VCTLSLSVALYHTHTYSHTNHRSHCEWRSTSPMCCQILVTVPIHFTASSRYLLTVLFTQLAGDTLISLLTSPDDESSNSAHQHSRSALDYVWHLAVRGETMNLVSERLSGSTLIIRFSRPPLDEKSETCWKISSNHPHPTGSGRLLVLACRSL